MRVCHGSDNQLVGAQDRQVEEPRQNVLSTSEATLFRPQAIIQVEFDEIAEPKGLSSVELLQLVKKFGSSHKVADAIGASVRQNISPKN